MMTTLAIVGGLLLFVALVFGTAKFLGMMEAHMDKPRAGQTHRVQLHEPPPPATRPPEPPPH